LNTIDQMAHDPQLVARDAFVELPSWKDRPFKVVNSPIKLSRTPVQLTRGADRPGAHTRAILQRQLGLDDEAIAGLLADGVVGESWE
jgi:crotonobetainyl-CoA:carnitine CoA-transferase CaiB-like acyl-CoA transferase